MTIFTEKTILKLPNILEIFGGSLATKTITPDIIRVRGVNGVVAYSERKKQHVEWVFLATPENHVNAILEAAGCPLYQEMDYSLFNATFKNSDVKVALNRWRVVKAIEVNAIDEFVGVSASREVAIFDNAPKFKVGNVVWANDSLWALTSKWKIAKGTWGIVALMYELKHDDKWVREYGVVFENGSEWVEESKLTGDFHPSFETPATRPVELVNKLMSMKDGQVLTFTFNSSRYNRDFCVTITADPKQMRVVQRINGEDGVFAKWNETNITEIFRFAKKFVPSKSGRNLPTWSNDVIFGDIDVKNT